MNFREIAQTIALPAGFALWALMAYLMLRSCETDACTDGASKYIVAVMWAHTKENPSVVLSIILLASCSTCWIGCAIRAICGAADALYSNCSVLVSVALAGALLYLQSIISENADRDLDHWNCTVTCPDTKNKGYETGAYIAICIIAIPVVLACTAKQCPQ